ncbi:hypothetical protein OROHE_021660 [Orobanche hederae]
MDFMKCSKGKGYFGGDSLGYIDAVLGSFLGWIKLTESGIGMKIFDEIRTPNLEKWVERFYSDAAAKDVLPNSQKLVEFYMSNMMVKATKC